MKRKPSDIDKLLKALCRDLKPILNAEIKAGNKVEEVHRITKKGPIVIIVEHPFKKKHSNLRNKIFFTYIREGGRWKGEYTCAAHENLVVCYF